MKKKLVKVISIVCSVATIAGTVGSGIIEMKTKDEKMTNEVEKAVRKVMAEKEGR